MGESTNYRVAVTKNQAGLRRQILRRVFLTFLAAMTAGTFFIPNAGTAAGRARPMPSPSPTGSPVPPAVINLTVIPADRAAEVLRAIYPHTIIRVDRSANALIVVAPPDQVNAMRVITGGIDVKNPTQATVETMQIHNVNPQAVVGTVHGVFPHARFTIVPNRTVIVVATPADMQQIRTLISSIDVPPATPTPKPVYPAEAVRVSQRAPNEVARALAVALPGVRASVSGASVLLSGPPDQVTQAKALIAQLDVPQLGVQYTQVYRLHYVDAASVADLLRRSFSSVEIQVDKDLNAITVFASTALHQRISDAINQLDAAPAGAPGSAPSGPGGGGTNSSEIIRLKAALPGPNGGPSTSATDLASTVQQALSNSAPDLKITVPPNATELVLTGSSYSIQQAKELIDKLDVPEPQVVLDTEVLEVDETDAKTLGIQFPQNGALVGTNFTEIVPQATTNANGITTTPALGGIQPFSRTPLSFGLQLNLLVQQGKAHVLADPRILTASNRTASIRAGDQIAIVTTAGGGTGTVATTQLQTFQTGVTLDITPIVNDGDYITINLHPVVNSLASVLNGIPQISTRDTQTVVGLHDNETLIIGGLIQINDNRTILKIPILGDLPLIGKLFQSSQLNYARDELVITVTPHIVRRGDNNAIPGPPLPAIPTPLPFPTLPPGTKLSPTSGTTRPAPVPTPAADPTPIAVPLPSRPPARQPTGSANAYATAAPSVTPQPLPSAFGNINVYTYGSAPANNFAAANAPVQIFFVQAQPTVLRNNQPMTLSVITSTNVDRLTFGTSVLAPLVSLSKVGPGQWQSTFNFSTAGLPTSQGNVQMLLRATSNFGAVTSVQVPVSVISE